MNTELDECLGDLIESLRQNKNGSADFFESVKNELKRDPENKDELDKLVSCFSITQYSNFSHVEEVLLNRIISLARAQLKKIS